MKRLFLFTAISLLASCSNYLPIIETPKKEVEDQLNKYVRSLNEYDSLYLNHTDTAFLAQSGDTITYTWSTSVESEIHYIFEGDTCVELIYNFSCMVCLNTHDRKWLFKGNWRQDERGYLYNYKKSLKASIRRINDCPYLYEVKMEKLKNPLKKTEWKEMKEVHKRLIGSRQYELRN